MISVLSPAKTLDLESKLPIDTHTYPDFLDDSKQLIEILKGYDEAEIGKLMKVSEKISALNVERNHSFQFPFTEKNARPAIFTFKGDVYRDLELGEYSEDDFDFLQDHVRILSGLYGVLRPFDLMQAYRLEMGTNLKNERGKNLYQFWGSKISEKLNLALEAQGDDVLVNLASEEYFGGIDVSSLKARIVKIVFLDAKKDKYRIVSIYAKQARGWMANWICRNHVDTVDGLKAFNVRGYEFSEKRSSKNELVFTRDKPA